MIIAVAGTKGAPGVTTASVGIACFLREKHAAVVVEADPDGGCLAARLELAQEPGLSTLAAAGRHELSETVLAGHLQGGPVGIGLVVSPSAPSQARAALRAATTLGRTLSGLSEIDVVVDVGRLDPESPSLSLVDAAELVLLLATPTLDGADAAAVRLAETRDLRPRTQLVTVGDGPYSGDEVAQVLGIDHAGHLPFDPAGASLLWSSTERALSSRRPLLRSLATFARRLAPPTDRTSLEAASSPDVQRRVAQTPPLARQVAP